MVEAGQELTARALVSLLRGSRRQARRQAAVGYARAEMWAWRGAAEAESHAAAHHALQVVAVGLFVQLWIHDCAVDSSTAKKGGRATQAPLETLAAKVRTTRPLWPRA